MRDIQISIVSHNQFNLVINLLSDLEKQEYVDRIYVILTINVPEIIPKNHKDFSFPIKLIHNSYIKGFSENHNAAFSEGNNLYKCKFFFVVNPDIRIHENVLSPLVNTLESSEKIGLTAPLVYGTKENLEDSSRVLPTPSGIIAKIFGRRGQWKNEKGAEPDWIAGMFMAFNCSCFRQIRGFNEKYFLYYEDVDICSRLWLEGYSIQVNNSVSIVHDAQRKSWRNIKYLRWHITSMLRFFFSDVYQKVKIHHEQRAK